MKKHFFLLFLLALLPMLAMADDSGSCGENVTYTYTEANYTLTIQGNGPMSDYSSDRDVPWYYYHGYITTVMIDDGVTSIGYQAFYNCAVLTSVTIPNSVTFIGSRAFFNCYGLTSIDIPNSVTFIGSSAFYGCKGLTSVIVENGNNKYDSRNNCNAIIETATNELILGCSTTVIPNSVTAIGNGAFQDCYGLTSITIPNSVTSIGYAAFRGCSGLTSVSIPNSVTSIGNGAFQGCSGLTSVTIGNSVTTIGGHVFASCEKLTTVNAMMTNPPEIVKSVFGYDDNIYQKAALYVPVGCKDIYSNTEGWKNFVNIEEKDFNATTTVKEDVNGDGKVNALDIQQVINVAAASE